MALHELVHALVARTLSRELLGGRQDEWQQVHVAGGSRGRCCRTAPW